MSICGSPVWGEKSWVGGWSQETGSRDNRDATKGWGPWGFPRRCKAYVSKGKVCFAGHKGGENQVWGDHGGGASPELLLGSWGLAEPSGGFEFFSAFFHVISPNESSLIMQMCLHG